MITARIQSTKLSKVMLMAAMTLVVFSADAAAQNASGDVKFPNEQWDLLSVNAVKAGPKYLPKNYDTGVKAPPANNSSTTRAELNELAANKRKVTSQQEQLILAEAQPGGVVQAFLLSGIFEIKDRPATTALIEEMAQDVDYFTYRDKLKFRRAAPSQLSSEVDVVGDVPSYPSYPSDHAIQAYMGAMIMSDLDPRNQGKYMALANDIVERRALGGLNYPSDIDAGKAAAVALYEGLRTQPTLNKLMVKAKEEF